MHWIMSFAGSVGKLMENSGLATCLYEEKLFWCSRMTGKGAGVSFETYS